MTQFISLVRILLLPIGLVAGAVAGFNAWAAPLPADLSPQSRQLYLQYWKSTYHSLNCMRGASGLPLDSARALLPAESRGKACPLSPDNVNTSPTNIALDLLVQLEALKDPEFSTLAKVNLAREMSTLLRLPRTAQCGLWFNRYATDGSNRVTENYISSVDNFHLALALWVISKSADRVPLTYSTAALALLDRMNFECLLNPASGMVSGGLRQVNGQYIREKWEYSYFGSEARNLYTAGWAMGLFKNPDFIRRAFSHLTFETISVQGQVTFLRTWDGGAFQLLLPGLLTGESNYSELIARVSANYALLILTEQKRRHLPVPAAHSACQAPASYQGNAGTVSLTSPKNPQLHKPIRLEQWEAIFTPHAAMLAAPFAPDQIAQALSKSETLVSAGFNLYDPRMGWLDGLVVKGASKGAIVPEWLVLDQAMIALTAAKILSPDRLGISERTLSANLDTRRRLQRIYTVIDHWIK